MFGYEGKLKVFLVQTPLSEDMLAMYFTEQGTPRTGKARDQWSSLEACGVMPKVMVGEQA